MIAMLLGYLLERKGRDGTGHILFGMCELLVETGIVIALLEAAP